MRSQFLSFSMRSHRLVNCLTKSNDLSKVLDTVANVWSERISVRRSVSAKKCADPKKIPAVAGIFHQDN